MIEATYIYIIRIMLFNEGLGGMVQISKKKC